MHERSHILSSVHIKVISAYREKSCDLSTWAAAQDPIRLRSPNVIHDLRDLVIDQSVAVARRLIIRERLTSRIKVRQGDCYD